MNPLDPTYAIFLKSWGFKDVKYDILVCHTSLKSQQWIHDFLLLHFFGQIFQRVCFLLLVATAPTKLPGPLKIMIKSLASPWHPPDTRPKSNPWYPWDGDPWMLDQSPPNPPTTQRSPSTICSPTWSVSWENLCCQGSLGRSRSRAAATGPSKRYFESRLGVVQMYINYMMAHQVLGPILCTFLQIYIIKPLTECWAHGQTNFFNNCWSLWLLSTFFKVPRWGLRTCAEAPRLQNSAT